MTEHKHCATCGNPTTVSKGLVYLETLDDNANWPCQPEDEVLLHDHNLSLADWTPRMAALNSFDHGYAGLCRVGVRPRETFPPCTNCKAHVSIGGAFARVGYPDGFEHMSHYDDGTWADEMCKREAVPGPIPIWTDRRNGQRRDTERRRR